MLLQNSFRLLTLRDFYELFVICFRSLSKKSPQSTKWRQKILKYFYFVENWNSFLAFFMLPIQKVYVTKRGFFLEMWGFLLSTHVFKVVKLFQQIAFSSVEAFYYFIFPWTKWEKKLFLTWSNIGIGKSSQKSFLVSAPLNLDTKVPLGNKICNNTLSQTQSSVFSGWWCLHSNAFFLFWSHYYGTNGGNFGRQMWVKRLDFAPS